MYDLYDLYDLYHLDRDMSDVCTSVIKPATPPFMFTPIALHCTLKPSPNPNPNPSQI